LFYFIAWNTSPHALLAFKISVKKSAVILVCLLLYVNRLFYLTVFNILFLFSVLIILTIICYGEVLFWSCLSDVLDSSCTWMGISFLRPGKFSDIILLDILPIPLTCTSCPSSVPMIHRFGLLMELQNSCICIPFTVLESFV
jgi:hypothetical protein